MILTDELHEFVLAWGELASRWGLNRTEACIHALLYISEEPLNMEEIADTLQIARSNASMSLKELQTWQIIKTVGSPQDRTRKYVSEKDPWLLFRNVTNEQKRRNIDPFVQLLQDTSSTLREKQTLNSEETHAHKQMTAMLDFFDIVFRWYGQINAVPLSEVRAYLTLGDKIRKFLKR